MLATPNFHFPCFSDRDIFNEKPSREEIVAATQVCRLLRDKSFNKYRDFDKTNRLCRYLFLKAGSYFSAFCNN